MTGYRLFNAWLWCLPSHFNLLSVISPKAQGCSARVNSYNVRHSHVCFSIKSTRVSAEHWKNRTEGNLNIYTKALTWSVPPVCSSLFAATNTTTSLFSVSGMFVYLKVLLLLSSDNRKVSALIPGCSSVLESVPWHKYWTSICWSEYECVYETCCIKCCYKE